MIIPKWKYKKVDPKSSYIMSKIKSKNTKIELEIFNYLRNKKINYRKHNRKLPGKPDIYLTSKKRAVFIHGDFWHGWQFPRWKIKMKNVYWKDKIEYNRRRHLRNVSKLKKMGWEVLTIWEHQIKDNKLTVFNRLKNFLE